MKSNSPAKDPDSFQETPSLSKRIDDETRWKWNQGASCRQAAGDVVSASEGL